MPDVDKIMVAEGIEESPGVESVTLESVSHAGEGHVYDLVPSEDKDEVTLTEDESNKRTLPFISEYLGTREAYEAMSADEQARYRRVTFNNESGSALASDCEITFTSSDTTDANANDWTSVTPLTSGLSLRNLFSRVSQMFKNVRYLFKILGTTDVSSFFGGSNQSVTAALDTLNSHIGAYTVAKDVPSNAVFTDTTTGTTYSAGSCPDNTTFATQGSVKRVYDATYGYACELGSNLGGPSKAFTTSEQVYTNTTLKTAHIVRAEIIVSGALESIKYVQLFPNKRVGFFVARSTSQYAACYMYWDKTNGKITYQAQTIVSYTPTFVNVYYS